MAAPADVRSPDSSAADDGAGPVAPLAVKRLRAAARFEGTLCLPVASLAIVYPTSAILPRSCRSASARSADRDGCLGCVTSSRDRARDLLTVMFEADLNADRG
jgi:hypothetical protein